MIFRKKKWEVAYAVYGGNQNVLLLEQGWEPFAVSPQNDQFATVAVIIWFRRRVNG